MSPFALRRGRWTPHDRDGTARVFADAREARAWLLRHAAGSALARDGALRTLRRTLAELDPARRVDALTDDEVLDQIAHRIAIGHIDVLVPAAPPDYVLTRPEPEAPMRAPEAPVDDEGSLWVHHDFETRTVTLAIDVEADAPRPELTIGVELEDQAAELVVEATVDADPWTLSLDANVDPAPWTLSLDADVDAPVIETVTAPLAVDAPASSDAPAPKEPLPDNTPWTLVDPLERDDDTHDDTREETANDETPWTLVDPLERDDDTHDDTREETASTARDETPWTLVDPLHPDESDAPAPDASDAPEARDA